MYSSVLNKSPLQQTDISKGFYEFKINVRDTKHEDLIGRTSTSFYIVSDSSNVHSLALSLK